MEDLALQEVYSLCQYWPIERDKGLEIDNVWAKGWAFVKKIMR